MLGGVFVCHASADHAAAERIVALLEAAGTDCWIAPRDIEAGQNYTQAILDGLEAAPALVLVFSATTNDSPHVQRELETAVGTGTAIVPVRLATVEPSRSLRYFIGTAQWLDTDGIRPAAWEPALVRAVQRAVRGRPVVREPAPVPEPRLPATGRRRRWLAPLAGAAAVLVVVAVGIAIAGTHGSGGAPQTRHGAGSPSSASSRSSSPSSSTSATGTSSGTSSGTSNSPSGSPSGSTSGTTPTGAARTGPVTCWNGAVAAGADACPLPTGRAGLESVFPSMTDACRAETPSVPGKREVYACQYGTYLIRYTRWLGSYDRTTYFDQDNGVPPAEWKVTGEVAGQQWTSVEHDLQETQPYQWTATYRHYPYSVSVEGVRPIDRIKGEAAVQAVAPSLIALR